MSVTSTLNTQCYFSYHKQEAVVSVPLQQRGPLASDEGIQVAREELVFRYIYGLYPNTLAGFELCQDHCSSKM